MSSRSPKRVSGLSNPHTGTRALQTIAKDAVSSGAIRANDTVIQRPRHAHAVVWEGSDYMEVRRERAPRQEGSGPEHGGGKRGRITKYTPGVRARCCKKISKQSKAHLPVELCLTYPDWWPVSAQAFLGDRKRFLERLRRRFPAASAIWVREHHSDGRPHLHALVWGVNCVLLRSWAATAWYEAVAIDDSRHKRHLAAGTYVKRVRSAKALKLYLTKYVSKTGVQKAVEEPWGRWWGVHNEHKLPEGKLDILPLSDAFAKTLIRTIKNRYGFRNCYFKSIGFQAETDAWERWAKSGEIPVPI